MTMTVFGAATLFFQVAPQLYSRGWVDPVPDPLLLRKSGSAGNLTRDLWICSQKLWSLDNRGGQKEMSTNVKLNIELLLLLESVCCKHVSNLFTCLKNPQHKVS
jgi:hypothetical protein